MTNFDIFRIAAMGGFGVIVGGAVGLCFILVVGGVITALFGGTNKRNGMPKL